MNVDFNYPDNDTIVAKWIGKRTLDQVTFSDGTSKKVQYMRDGLVMFEDNTYVLYVRTQDNYPNNVIIISPQ